ncbi:hypothetical protein [Mameliella alba]|uniref:hypothetical protein n=1 Tax=Mameliella alba TaxID=561184 RepID=UPI0011B28558|nr:hypothetical protein [Mameliella alba]
MTQGLQARPLSHFSGMGQAGNDLDRDAGSEGWMGADPTEPKALLAIRKGTFRLPVNAMLIFDHWAPRTARKDGAAGQTVETIAALPSLTPLKFP